MAWAFKRKETITKALHRLARKRIAHAVDCLREGASGHTVHGARKDLKKVRALVRLVRGRIEARTYRRLTGRFRAATRKLSPMRDAFVRAETLKKLEDHFGHQIRSPAWRGLRPQLRAADDAERRRSRQARTVRAVRRLLGGVTREVEAVKVRGRGWSAIANGVRSTYREGRRAYRRVLREPTADGFHAWRKRAKDLSYHLRLLHPLWPEQMEAMASELATLTEILGDDHDLAMLREWAAASGPQPDRPGRAELLSGLIDLRQRELRAAALDLGARFYAEKPSEFCGRIHRYWRTWRKRRGRVEARTDAAPVS